MSEFPPTPTNTKAESELDALKVVFVDQSQDARDAARDEADARLDKELGEGGKVKKFLSGIWKGNIAKEYYRQKYIREAESQINESNDIYLGKVSGQDRAEMTDLMITRFQSDNGELFHSEAGERREVRRDDDALTGIVKELIREYASGTITSEQLKVKKDEKIAEYRETYGDELLGKGIASVDNLISVAEAITGNIDHYESLDHAVESVQVVVGEARNGARTEARYSAADKIIDKLTKTRVGALVTPATLATAVAATLAVTRVGTQSVVGSAAATIAPGIVAGAWAGVRENKRVKDERAQHARELAVGGQFEASDKRRVEMDAARYETVAANDLISELRAVTHEDKLNEGNDALQEALEAIARAQARVSMSDEKHIDLVSYSSQAAVGKERMLLDIARVEARTILEDKLDAAKRAELNLPADVELQYIIKAQADRFANEALNKELSAKDEAFQKLKRKRVITAAATSTIVGVAGGLLVQEVASAIDPSRYGLVDMALGQEPTLHDGQVHQSILAGAFNGDTTTLHTEASAEYSSHDTVPESSVSVSNDHEWVKNEQGTYDIVTPNGDTTVEGVTVQPDGRIDPAEIARLEEAGMTVKETVSIETITETHTEQLSIDDYFERHSGETQQVSIDKWFNNNTPYSDQNELRVYRGGENGIIENGYRLEAGGMTQDGSWLGGERVNPIDAAQQGNLILVISRMGEDAGPMFTVQGDADGGFNIMNDTPEAALFTNVNGQMELADGLRASVYVNEGVDENGMIRGGSLATMVGEAQVGSFTDTVETVREVPHYSYEITTQGYDTSYENVTEIAPITPITSRKSMEAIPGNEAATISPETPYDYYNAALTERETQQVAKELSPRLQQNPDEKLNVADELNWFHDELARRNGPEYVADLDAFVENNPALKAMSAETASIVTIPVAAAAESDNIYSVLSLLAQQEKGSTETKTVLLNVNWLDTHIDDPEKIAAIQKTLSEIERARRSFANLSIAVIQKEYNQAQVEATGGVIGYVAEDLVNTALLAVQKKIASGEMASDHDVLIVRSDADVRGMSRTQLRNFERAASENQDLDIVKGVTRFGVAEQQRFPGFGIATAFTNAVSIASTQENAMHTGGANFAVRASTFAAIGGLGTMYRESPTGELKRYTGAGSDDTFIGRRIRVARKLGSPANEYYFGTRSQSTPGSDTRRIKLVAGAAIDTNPERVLPYYLRGMPFQAAWNEGVSGAFGDGPGNYRNRDADAGLIESSKSENNVTANVYKAIETNISLELQWASDAVARKTLGLFFGSVPGAYRIRGNFGESGVKFELTEAGRTYIKNRIQRESNGTFGSYGARKMRQLYGQVKPGASRQAAGSRPPLVSPLT